MPRKTLPGASALIEEIAAAVVGAILVPAIATPVPSFILEVVSLIYLNSLGLKVNV